MKERIKEAILAIVIDEVAKNEEVELAEIYGGIMSGVLSAIGTIAQINKDDPFQTVERICTETYYQIKSKEGK